MVVVEFEHGPPTSFTESQIIALNSHLDVVNMDYYVTDKKLQHLLHLNEFVFLFQWCIFPNDLICVRICFYFCFPIYKTFF